jgi:hypothetical protein
MVSRFQVYGSGIYNTTTVHVTSTDIMLSPGMTSLGRISVGQGRVPFHGPTIGQSIGPWHRQSRVLRGSTWNKSHVARLSMLLLSKAYPFHGILSHVTRCMKALNGSGFRF